MKIINLKYLIFPLLALSLTSQAQTSSQIVETNNDFYQLVKTKCKIVFENKDFKLLEKILDSSEFLVDNNGYSALRICTNNLGEVIANQLQDPNSTLINSILDEWRKNSSNSFWPDLIQAKYYLRLGNQIEGAIKDPFANPYQYGLMKEYFPKADALLGIIEKKYPARANKNLEWLSLKRQISVGFDKPEEKLLKYNFLIWTLYPYELEGYEYGVKYLYPSWFGKPNYESIKKVTDLTLKNLKSPVREVVYAQILERLAFKAILDKANSPPCPMCMNDGARIKPAYMDSKAVEEGTKARLKAYPSQVNFRVSMLVACARQDTKMMKFIEPSIEPLSKVKNTIGGVLTSPFIEACIANTKKQQKTI